MGKLNIYQGVRRISSLSLALLTLGGCSSYKLSSGDNNNEVKVTISQASESKEYCFNKPYCWPIGDENVKSNDNIILASADSKNIQIVSNYGYNNAIYDESSKIIAGDYHRGIDIVGQGDDVNIIAANDGIVIYTSVDNKQISNKSGYGNYVVIKHNDSNFTLYGHLQDDSITVETGDTVCKGQILGKMGQTGNAYCPHLHFEIRKGNNSCYSTVDPMDYIDNNKVKTK